MGTNPIEKLNYLKSKLILNSFSYKALYIGGSGQMTNNPSRGSNLSAVTSSLCGNMAHYRASLNLSGLSGKMEILKQSTDLNHFFIIHHPCSYTLFFCLSFKEVSILFNDSLAKPLKSLYLFSRGKLQTK